MKVFNFLFVLVIISQISKSYSEDHNGILNYLKESNEYSYFFKLIKKDNYENIIYT